MNLSLRFSALRFALPPLIIAFLVLLAGSSLFVQNPDQLAIGITADLLFTVPLVWWLVIRKTKIPKTTVLPVALLGALIGGLILPAAQQGFLHNVKNILFPLAELLVLGFVAGKVWQVRRSIKARGAEQEDMWWLLNEAMQAVIPGRAGHIFATEMAVFYYGLFAWRQLSPKGLVFTNHEKSANLAILLTLLLVVLIETVVLHLLLVDRWPVLAWVLFGLSLYSGLMLIALAKGMSRRPLLLDPEAGKLYLRYSFFAEACVDLAQLESITHVRGDLPEEEEIRRLSVLQGLEEVNMVFRFREKQNLHLLYGAKKEAGTLACWVDDHEGLQAAIAAWQAGQDQKSRGLA